MRSHPAAPSRLTGLLPTLTIASPVRNSTINSLTAISGKASDNVGGSGVAQVELTFGRLSDSTFWNGSAWGSTTPVTLATTLSGANWSKTSGLPDSDSTDPVVGLQEGVYLLTAYVFDNAGNKKSISEQFAIDKTPPAVLTVTSPTQGQQVASIGTITGVVADGGNSLGGLQLFLQRDSPLGHWTGSAWDATTEHSLPTKLGSNNTYSSSGALPSPSATSATAKLTPGSYTIRVQASDKAGNVATVTRNFMVVAAQDGTTTVASTIRLSSASVNSSTSTIALSFSGALDPVSAGTPAHYTVYIGTRQLVPMSAARQSAGNTVVLTVPTGSIVKGRTVGVAWADLSAADGSQLNGNSGWITAK